MAGPSIVWRIDSSSVLSGEEKSAMAEKMLEIGERITDGAGVGELSMGERHMQLTITIRTTAEISAEAKKRAHALAGQGWGRWFAKAALWIRGASDRWDDFMRGMEDRQASLIKNSILDEANKRLSAAIGASESLLVKG